MARRSRADRFLVAYSGIERHLRDLIAADASVRFYELVNRAGKDNPAVAAFSQDLKEYADLRNAIVHAGRELPMADPYPETVAGIEHLREVLRRPPLLADVVEVKKVEVCEPMTPLAKAMAVMYKGNFSQLPVLRSGRVADLLTAETVMRFVSSLVPEVGRLVSASVGDALGHAEDRDNFAVVAADATVFDALSLFRTYSDGGRSLDAVVVADQNGLATPRSIVTTFDIPQLLAAVRRGP